MIRDPESFIVHVEEELNKIQVEKGPLQELVRMTQAIGMAQGQEPTMPAPEGGAENAPVA